MPVAKKTVLALVLRSLQKNAVSAMVHFNFCNKKKKLSQLWSALFFAKKKTVQALVNIVLCNKKNCPSSGPHRYVFLAWQQQKKVQMETPERRWVVLHVVNSRFLHQYRNCSQGGREHFEDCQKTEHWFASRWKFLLSRGQIEHGLAEIEKLNRSLLQIIVLDQTEV